MERHLDQIRSTGLHRVVNDGIGILTHDLVAERDAKCLLRVLRRPDQTEGAGGGFDEAEKWTDAGAGADDDDAVEKCCYAHNTACY